MFTAAIVSGWIYETQGAVIDVRETVQPLRPLTCRYICVSVTRETTLDTKEIILSTAIDFIDATAYRASARSVVRINSDDRHAGKARFILKELAQLEKRPTVQCRSLRLASLYPITDAGKLLLLCGDDEPHQSRQVLSI